MGWTALHYLVEVGDDSGYTPLRLAKQYQHVLAVDCSSNMALLNLELAAPARTYTIGNLD